MMKYILGRALASRRPILLSVVMMLFSMPARSYGAEPDKTAPAKEQRESLKKYIPEVTGEIKTRFEWRTNGRSVRFNVRNARLRANGYVNPYVNYRFFLDFHDQGKINILDAYIVARYKGWEVVLGQQRADLDRSLNPYFFANRSFLIKFMASHYAVGDVGDDAVNIQGWRDMGAQFSYRFAGRVPVRVAAGIFNGSGLNNPQWQSSTLSYVGRIEIGHKFDGLGIKTWYYSGALAPLDKTVIVDGMQQRIPHRQKMRMAAAGIHYAHKRYYVESEYGFKNLLEEPGGKTMHTAYVQGIYAFPFPERIKIFRYAAPVFRWDYGANIDYLNAISARHDRFTGHRITAGVNFGFIDAIMISELRFNFEKFLFADKPSDLGENNLIQDKFTIELCLQF